MFHQATKILAKNLSQSFRI